MKIDEINLKKLENTSQDSNRPESILSNSTKLLGSILIAQAQLNHYMENSQKISRDLGKIITLRTFY